MNPHIPTVPSGPRMHPITLRFSPENLELQMRGESFWSSFPVTIFVFITALCWHCIWQSLNFEPINTISIAGCAVFLAFRYHLHTMASQQLAHDLFSRGWCMIFVFGHMAFIVGQRQHPQRVDATEAVGTACIWIVLCLLQQIAPPLVTRTLRDRFLAVLRYPVMTAKRHARHYTSRAHTVVRTFAGSNGSPIASRRPSTATSRTCLGSHDSRA